MSDSSNADQHLRATEAQMRRALGLEGHTSPASAHQPSTPAPNGVHRGHRRFVRDGEVPVTILHHEQNEGSGTNKLDEARKALQDQIAAREHAERQLQEAQAAIENLQTHLAHERIAAHEATQKAEAAGLEIEQTLQATREELDAERHAHQQAKQQRDQAVAACQVAEDRLGDAMGSQNVQAPRGTARHPNASSSAQKPRRRPAKAAEPDTESEFVEWWTPGWRNLFK
jgi:hypothetical protein